jgi:hypothetical protein
MGTGGFSLGANFYLMPRSRMCGAITPLHHMSSWRGAELMKHREIVTFYLAVLRFKRY